jgi:hypothetical protein
MRCHPPSIYYYYLAVALGEGCILPYVGEINKLWWGSKKKYDE